jgi:hypothetical protein
MILNSLYERLRILGSLSVGFNDKENIVPRGRFFGMPWKREERKEVVRADSRI